MTSNEHDGPPRPTARPLRLWPGVVIATLQILLRFAVPAVFPAALPVGAIAGVVGGLAIVMWWLFFSRAPWLDRIAGVALILASLVTTKRLLLHESIETGMMGMMYPIYAIPVLSAAFVAWAVVSRGLSSGIRRAAMVATILIACGGWALLRTGGSSGEFEQDFAWRWSPTPEERLLARAGDEPMRAAPASAAEKETRIVWPGFRGPGRDGRVPGVRIATDWSASPPAELWRRRVGPGWSSFAVRGDLVYTQEQRGEDEVVACHRLTTGEPVWRHLDAARFWESIGGAGPRGTPTLHGDRVYTLGATGLLNALGAADGTVVWSRDAAADSGREVPYWGFSSSPLVVDQHVVVAMAGTLVAYDLTSGELAWSGPDGGGGYSSPHLVTIAGVPQVVLMSSAGVVGVAPTDGQLLWRHPSPSGIVQPARTADGALLVSGADRSGLSRIAVTLGPGGWAVEEVWTSIRLKPYYNDFVVHEGHAYGFDGNMLACIDVRDGERRWKGGRYGYGQLILLPDQDLLLVLSEKGELALVGASPGSFAELARSPALEGKTWNHPVLVDDVLLVRNAEEMAAFRLTLADG